MKTKNTLYSALLGSIAMMVLILDTKTALYGGAEGIRLCLEVLIPSLFPFILASIVLTAAIAALQPKILRPLGRILGLPRGAEGIFLIGLLGGYPIGAQCVAQASEDNVISASAARRMLAFCSNAGPAFLFGVGARLFSQVWMCWLLWGIHILSAVITGLLTPGNKEKAAFVQSRKPLSLSQALGQAVHVMGLICGWVMVFRVILAFCQRWFVWLLPNVGQMVFSGVLELANGCSVLAALESLGLRFTLCSVFLGFGGLCVALQTASVAQKVDRGLYLPGKLTQSAISLLLCQLSQLLLPANQRHYMPVWVIAVCICIPLIYYIVSAKIQKNSSILQPIGV